MKSYTGLFEKVCSFSNLHLGYRRARRWKRDKPAVMAFDFRQEEEIIRLERRLRAGAYRPGGYRNFTIFEPKRRVISATPFRDRVVHHAICNVIEPIFERRLQRFGVCDRMMPHSTWRARKRRRRPPSSIE